MVTAFKEFHFRQRVLGDKGGFPIGLKIARKKEMSIASLMKMTQTELSFSSLHLTVS
jgi:hypothetical protein